MVDCPQPPPPVWGQWLACADGRSHYRLGTGMLCGSVAAPSGERVRTDTTKQSKILVPYCDRCSALNLVRWASLRT